MTIPADDFQVQEAGRVIGPCSVCKTPGHTKRSCPERSDVTAAKVRKVGSRTRIISDDTLFRKFVTKIILPTTERRVPPCPAKRKRSLSSSR